MTLADPEVQDVIPAQQSDDGDHDRFAHYVIGGHEAIMRAIVNGTPCTALCGKIWVPDRDPEKFPVCPLCEEEQKRLGKNVEP